MIFWIWSAVVAATIVLYFRQRYNYFTRYGVKHLPVTPLLGNMAGIIFRFQNFHDNLTESYHAFPKDRFHGRYEFTKPSVVIRDPELIKRVTIKDFEYFLDRRRFVSADIEPLFARALFFLNGEDWKDMRSTLSPAFTSSKIRVMVPFMVEVAENMMRSLKKKIKDSGADYIDINSKDVMTQYASDVIASCAFGLKVDSYSEPDNQFYKMGLETTNFKFWPMITSFLLAAFPKIMGKMNLSLFPEHLSRFFRELVVSTMKDREAHHIIRPDMIHLLMEAKKGKLTHDEKTSEADAGFSVVEESTVGKKKVHKEWTDNDLAAQAVVFFLAGFETAASGMSFLLYELAVNPEVQEKLVQEIRENETKNGGKFDYKSVQELTYLDMVISELLRLWPPGVAMNRICTKDYNLGKVNDKAKEDFIVRNGQGVVIPIWAFHRDPELFPDPLKFDPERFSEENKHKIKPFSYMPFGVGPRNCIGSRFALCKLKVMIYQLLKVMEVSMAPKTKIPLQLATDTLNLRVQGGLWARLRVRS